MSGWGKSFVSGSIVWVSAPGPQGGWGRLKSGEDGKLEFVSFARVPPTEEEQDTITKMCLDLPKEEEGEDVATALKAWVIGGIVQSGYHGDEMTPEQARILARSLQEAADRAELHIETMARMAAKVIRQDEDWDTHGTADR